MKFDYRFIKQNIEIYEEAKRRLPLISDYEQGLVTYDSMRSLNMESFGDFANFLRDCNKIGCSPISAITYKELKTFLVKDTHLPRFSTWIKRRTQKQFNILLSDNPQDFDRLLNGRWITKPGYNGRGRRSWGRRHVDFFEGLDSSFIPLINYIISNDVEVSEKSSDTFKSFANQDKYLSRMKWYKSKILSLDKIPYREIEITRDMLTSLIDVITETKIDFRKLNSDLILDALRVKIYGLMSITSGTRLRSIVTEVSSYGTPRLTLGKEYVVISSSINLGFLRVQLEDDSGGRNYYEYSKFEDKAIDRDLLLHQLGII